MKTSLNSRKTYRFVWIRLQRPCFGAGRCGIVCAISMNNWLPFVCALFIYLLSLPFLSHRKSSIWQKTSWPHSPLMVLPVPMAQTLSPPNTPGNWGTGVWLCGVRTDSECHQPLLMKTLHATICFMTLSVWIRVVVLWIRFCTSVLVHLFNVFLYREVYSFKLCHIPQHL